MAMSGVELDAQCKVVYDEVQSKKKHRYVTFMIDGGKIKIDKIGDRANTYDDFLGDLMVKDGDADDCRYAIYDYEYVVHSQGTEPSNRSRLFLVAWCPDSARIKKKMVYSASFDSLKKAFTGVQKIIQANGADEVEQSYVENLLRSAARTWNFRFRFVFCSTTSGFNFSRQNTKRRRKIKQANDTRRRTKNVIWK